jgi:hypothetical protein
MDDEANLLTLQPKNGTKIPQKQYYRTIVSRGLKSRISVRAIPRARWVNVICRLRG